MQIWAESGKSALPICNYSQILYQFLTFTQNLKRSRLWLFFTLQSVKDGIADSVKQEETETREFDTSFFIIVI